MKEKIIGIINVVIKKIVYGKKINFLGIPEFDVLSRISIKQGSKISIGNHFKIRSNSYIAAVDGSNIIIGDHVFINRNCNIICRDSIVIGEQCLFGPNVVIYDHDHCFNNSGIEKGYKTAPIVIEAKCWVGAGSMILRGTHIGTGSIIGAGTVIKGEIPAHSLVVSKGNRDVEIKPIKNNS